MVSLKRVIVFIFLAALSPKKVQKVSTAQGKIKSSFMVKFVFGFAMRSDIKNDTVRTNSYPISVFRVSVS